MCLWAAQVLDLGDVYENMPKGQHMYRVTAMFSFYNGHYSALVKRVGALVWTSLDDTSISTVGDWAGVLKKCQDGQLQPLVIFFDKLASPKVAFDGQRQTIAAPHPAGPRGALQSTPTPTPPSGPSAPLLRQAAKTCSGTATSTGRGTGRALVQRAPAPPPRLGPAPLQNGQAPRPPGPCPTRPLGIVACQNAQPPMPPGPWAPGLLGRAARQNAQTPVPPGPWAPGPPGSAAGQNGQAGAVQTPGLQSHVVGGGRRQEECAGTPPRRGPTMGGDRTTPSPIKPLRPSNTPPVHAPPLPRHAYPQPQGRPTGRTRALPPIFGPNPRPTGPAIAPPISGPVPPLLGPAVAQVQGPAVVHPQYQPPLLQPAPVSQALAPAEPAPEVQVVNEGEASLDAMMADLL
jgi:hypothetical protein